MKSKHPAVRSSGVQPQATAGQVPQLPSDCLGFMPKIPALGSRTQDPPDSGSRILDLGMTKPCMASPSFA